MSRINANGTCCKPRNTPKGILTADFTDQHGFYAGGTKRTERSSRNFPLRTSSAESRLVAAISLTLTLRVWELPRPRRHRNGAARVRAPRGSGNLVLLVSFRPAIIAPAR